MAAAIPALTRMTVVTIWLIIPDKGLWKQRNT